MSQILVLFILAGALFAAAFAAGSRADKHGKLGREFREGTPSRVHHELVENSWEILCVISLASSVMLGVIGLVFAIV